MKLIMSFFIIVISFCVDGLSYAETIDPMKTDPVNDVVKVRRAYNTIIIDYFYNKGHVSRYYHFLKNHPRHHLYRGQAVFFRKNPITKAWVNRKREVAFVHYGQERYDCSLIRYRYTICAVIQERLLYWEKRLDINRRIKEAGGES